MNIHSFIQQIFSKATAVEEAYKISAFMEFLF